MTPPPVAVGARSLVRELAGGDTVLQGILVRGLDDVERRLYSCVESTGAAFVTETAGHVVKAGGKRLRPLLTLLGARFGTGAGTGESREPNRVVDAAVAAELLHVASLYHDDVVDEAATRHGVESANARWGNSVAVFTGDWLLARAAQVASGLGEEAVRLVAETSGRLVEGQLRELVGPGKGESQLLHYFDVTAGKTASLIAVSLRMGALQAKAPRQVIHALEEYGEHLGTAFQISDDILDITAPQEATGKEQGKDLASGVASLPVLLSLCGPGDGGRELQEILERNDAVRGAQLETTLQILQNSSAVVQARSVMLDRLARARLALAAVPRIPAVKVLEALCDFVAERRE
ncbi:polyprenyl synthetase family protein [Streptomyces sp. TR06-5]|uniref:polyprenyl synthetase family protein n=1 Tax=unclassified Streptomyces TaxID=2593676 RepID=UPI0039A1C836